MDKLPQLIMRHPDLTDLPPLVLPDGFDLHTHNDGDEDVWEAIIEAAFGTHFNFDFIRNGGDYKPEHVLYLRRNGIDIATTAAIENDKYPNEGWFRMVAVHPDARGLGAGRMITMAALHALAARGYKSACLSTDDERIPAINLYLSIGFRPLMTHESHPQRWKKIKKMMP